MNSTLKVTKCQLRDIKKTIIIFYTIIVAITVIAMIITRVNSQTKVEMSFGGFGISTVIFIFISGLNCFRLNFMFMQANNISRKRFFYANIITLISVAAFMAIIDVILNNILQLALPYKSMFEQLYRKNFFFADFLWSFAFYAFAAILGWLITMIYYRCNKLMKTIVSIMPVLLMILLGIIDTKGIIGKAIIEFLGTALGFSNNFNSYMAVLSFVIGTIGLAALSFLLIRKMPIRY